MLVLLTGWFVRRGLGGRRGPWNSPGQHLMLSIVAEGGAAVFASLCTILYRVWHHGGGHLHLRWHPAGVGTICSYIYCTSVSLSSALTRGKTREHTRFDSKPPNSQYSTVHCTECRVYPNIPHDVDEFLAVNWNSDTLLPHSSSPLMWGFYVRRQGQIAQPAGLIARPPSLA